MLKYILNLFHAYFSFLPKLLDKRYIFYLSLIRQCSQYFNIILNVPFLKCINLTYKSGIIYLQHFLQGGKREKEAKLCGNYHFLLKKTTTIYFSDYMTFHVGSCLPFPQTSNMLGFYCQSVLKNLFCSLKSIFILRHFSG